MWIVLVTPPVITDVVVAHALTGTISPPASKGKLASNYLNPLSPYEKDSATEFVCALYSRFV